MKITVQPQRCTVLPPKARKRIFVMLAVLCASGPCETFAAPYTPTDDSAVVAELPTVAAPAISAQARGARALGILARKQPGNLDVAVQAAQVNLRLAQSESDPRYAGHAEAALAPWWSAKDPPLMVLLLRAAILQQRHEFNAALADLDTLIKAQPDNAQALLTRAVIYQVQGRFTEAAKDCAALGKAQDGLAAVACADLVRALTGDAAAAITALDRATADSGDSPAVMLWAYTLLGEAAERLGRAPEAEAYYKKAFATGVKDGYLTTAYADFLLGQNRPAEVVALLKDFTAVDPFLLRLTEAERRLDSPAWRAHAGDLKQRFADAAARGDVVHRREEARFRLRLADDPAGALRLADANWQVQREPADALVYLEAAAAAADRTAAAPVMAWIKTNKLEDVRIAPLVARLGGST